MRFLHTSDWHLGRSLCGADLSAAQESFLDHVVETVSSESVDVVVVSGDVYDRAIPPVHAVSLLEDGLARIRAAGAEVIAISGNHDSPARLGFGARLMAPGGVHIRTAASQVATPVIIDGVGFYCLPYLEPDAVHALLPSDPLGSSVELARTHGAVTARAMSCVRSDAASRGLSRVVVLAHAWVTGGAASDSERDITVGGVGTVASALFDGIDYVALGHLHQPQSIDAHLRYSGSPLAYSFSEARHVKGSWLVTLTDTGVSAVEAVRAPVQRRLAIVTGTLEELLSSSAHEADESAFVSATATDATRPVEAMERLRSRFPHILAFKWAPPAQAGDLRSYTDRVQGKSDLDLALDFVAHVRSPAEADERYLLTEAVSASRIQDEAGAA